ncbi:S8 family serine peptidase [Massilia terrae]|uniref:S8 family serine peptidase n=1 Tax=Massilia terrae TaxID=1811224 RepID=A0ABT2CXZ6_9BURK|nr:S8 family serine peptidase [Massilia terrae]MCS0658431.1 S8 family serine peptidase [Massilia terrae]
MRKLLLLLAALAAAGGAAAQLRLPSLNLPQGLGALDELRRPAQQLVDRVDLPDLRTLRLDQVGQLLRRHPDVLEADPRGEPVLRGEILAWNPSPAALDAARGAGLRVAREERFEELDQILVTLRVPEGAGTAQVLDRLRARDPDGHYDFNHIYTGSGTAPASASAGDAASAPADQGTPGVGLVDSGVDRSHRSLHDSRIQSWGCGGTAHPSTHGTAVAALMVGRDGRFRGAAPGMQLYAADIYCDDPAGGSAERIAAALAWLAHEQVGVINLSLVGPPNQALERVVAAMVKRGHLLVAAVGNDGPAAPPLYPASYPGVVGVTGISRNGDPLPEAARGPQVMFAAPGNNMVSAVPGDPPYRTMRGTSFAAPIVAGLLAPKLVRPDRNRAHDAVDALARSASGVDKGAISNSLGYGIVGADVRTDPAWLR